MSGVLRFDVAGDPAPQGSKRIVAPKVVKEDNPRTEPWRKTVAAQVRSQLPVGHVPYDGPVFLSVLFAMAPHGSVPKRRRSWPSTKFAGSGDEDKLVRACCDALTAAGVWTDDSRVVRTLSGTDWVGAPGFRATPGVRIVVAPIESDFLADVVLAWLDDVTATELVAS